MSCPSGCGGTAVPQNQAFETTIASGAPDTIYVKVNGATVSALVDHLGGNKYRITVAAIHMVAPGPIEIGDSGGCIDCREITT